jgi:asparagine synthase (glutamine-hydrolysing)
MSGILGIWYLDGRPVDRFELARLSATLRHRGPDADGFQIDGSVGLACRLARIAPESTVETQPVADAAGAILVFDGRLDNRDELLTALERELAVAVDAPDSVLALAAYRAFGDEFPARLNGDFVLALFDRCRRQVLLARDAIGVRPLYYYANGDMFLFASEIKTLLSHPRVETRPDDGVLADFVFTRFAGQEPRELTFFENIASVLPAHVVIAGRHGVRTNRYWDFDLTSKVRFARFQDYADAFKEHFERAVRRRLRSAAPLAVSVSGGLDSSAIFCVAQTLARRERRNWSELLGVSMTFPDGSPSDEKSLLLDIERAYGLGIWRLENLPVGIIDACHDAIRHAEAPFLDGQWSATHAQLLAIRKRGVKVLLTGHWGDQLLFDDAYLVDLCRRGEWRTAWRHVTAYSRWIDISDAEFKRRLCTGLLTYHVPDSVISALRRVRNQLRFRSEFRPWYSDAFRRRAPPVTPVRKHPATSASAHARALYREVRSQYAVSCMECNNKIAAMHGLEMAFPFLDRDLIAFLMAIPGETQSRNGVPKGILREALAGVVPKTITSRVSKADFTDRVNAGLAKDRAAVVQCLQTGGTAVEWGYVCRERLEEFTAPDLPVKASTAEASWAVCDLFSLELWLQEFFGSKAPIRHGGS